jgi:isoleucyl-tRNA synthetase
MKLSNVLADVDHQQVSPNVYYHSLRTLSLLLAPMAPHVAAEMWQLLYGLQQSSLSCSSSWSGGAAASDDVFAQPWPQSPVSLDELQHWQLHQDASVDVVVCFDGKKAGTVQMPVTSWSVLCEADNATQQTQVQRLLADSSALMTKLHRAAATSSNADSTAAIIQKCIVVGNSKLINIIRKKQQGVKK